MNPATSMNTFEPTDLAFLQRFFDGLCAERGVNGDSLTASNLAVRIIQLYQQGVRDEKNLQIQLEGVASQS